MSLLAVEAVGKSYGRTAALDGVTLALAAGSRMAVVGPSGSGKTTLLRLLAGFEVPDAGRIVLAGDTLTEPGRMVPAHRRGIGLVAQDGALFPHLSVGDNIGFGLGRRDPDRGSRIAALMDMVELEPAMARRRPDQLSGGQQQRVALARALARQPRLLLLDEPFSALDTGLRLSTRDAVAALLTRTGIAAILVTHDQEEALSFADHLAVLSGGRLLQAGPPQELYRRPTNATVARFLGEALLLPAEVADGEALCMLGRIRVGDRRRRGAATLMLRPEQIAVTPALSDSAEHRGTRIVAIAGAGAVSTLTLRLDPATAGRFGAEATLRLRGSFTHPFAAGDRVALSVLGEAHVLDANGADTVPDLAHRSVVA